MSTYPCHRCNMDEGSPICLNDHRCPRFAPRILIDSFTGALGDLPKGGRSIENALRALQTNPRVSTFERGPAWLESLIREMLSSGVIVNVPDEPYPWHRFALTELGLKVLKESTK